MSASLSTPPNRLPSLRKLPRVLRSKSMRPRLWMPLIFLGPIFLLALKLVPALDQAALHEPLSHLLISGDASLLSAALAVLTLRVAYRAQDGRIFLVGMGFLSTTTMLIVHYRLSTIGMRVAACDFVTQWPPLLSLAVGGTFFALSGLDLSPGANSRLMRLAGIGLVIYLVAWLFYSWIFLTWLPGQQAGAPGCGLGSYGVGSTLALLPTHPVPLDTLRLVFGIGGLGCYAFAVRRHYRLYRRSPSPAGLAHTCGIALFGEALLSVLLSLPYHPSFWLYHVELAAGYSVIGYAMLRAYHHGQTDENLLERLFLSGTRTRLQANYAQTMDELIATLANAEHPPEALRRTLQQRFGLTGSQLDVLAQAATAVAQERRQRLELQQLNAALHQLEQDKSLFTQMLVHDLKNPLAGQLGCLELLQRESLTEYQRLLLESSLRSSKNLSNLIANMLDLSRLETGHLELEHSLVPPRDLLDDCANELRGWVVEECKSIQVEVAVDLPLLQVDLLLMRRVLLNLLSNAIKHTPAGTSITLRAYAAGEQPLQGVSPDPASAEQHGGSGAARITIEVADTGQGIPAADLERIFEKYVRVGGRRLGHQDSTGLGLTFCRLAIEAHGGKIDVASQVNVGTTFRLELPAI